MNKHCFQRALARGIKQVRVRVRGLGPGRMVIILHYFDFN